MVSRALLALLWSGALGLLSAGCGGKVDEDQCKELTSHLVDLLADEGAKPENAEKVKANVKTDPRAELVSKETCVGKITVSQYKCMKTAKSVEKFVACEK
jgi:hypothetical protein